MKSSHPSELMQIADEYHRSGRLAEAEQIYRQVLSQNPAHWEALHMLGVVAGRWADPMSPSN